MIETRSNKSIFSHFQDFSLTILKGISFSFDRPFWSAHRISFERQSTQLENKIESHVKPNTITDIAFSFINTGNKLIKGKKIIKEGTFLT